MQDEIALAVVDALKLKLLGKEKAAVLKRATDNVEAYQLLLKGRYHWYKQMPDSVRKSRDYFQQAIELDPAFAPGYAGLSEYYGLSAALGMMPGAEGWPLAEAAMMKAQELDNSLPEIHNGLAAIRMFYYRDWQGAEREIKRTIELNPKFAEVHCLHSYCLVAMGRLDDAIAEVRRACELDPLSTTYNRYLGKTFYYARQYDEAIAGFQQAIDLDANNAPVHEDLGQVFHQTGYHRQAIAEYQKALELVGDVEGAATLGSVYARDGFDRAIRMAAERELEQLKVKLDQGEYVPAIRLAHAYTTLDQTEDALAWLEKACEERNAFPLFIHVDPFYDRLRSDARFTDLLERFSLAGAAAAPAVTKTRNLGSPGFKHSRRYPEPLKPKVVPDQTPAPGSKAKRYLVWSGLGILLLIAAGLVYWFYPNRRPQIDSIAVMPIVNASGNSEVEYLSDGMTDMLITSLSQVPNLSVKAHSSVFRYKNRDAPPQQVGKELNVQAVLNGRVVQRGSDLALHIELVDVRTETTLWVADYSRSISDLAAVQNEVARDVSQKLRTRLSGPEQQKVTKDYTANSEARDLYLRGVSMALS